ncbi:ATP-grasp fold amidoligase family protein, partial [Brachyspira pulli]|uniref:ATP-grasp fold amidoligase family protein n=1 Tax=Brachyspira pulli TaxID=310721 RepID=UPI003007ED08
YIKEKIGEEYLIPLLGVWDKVDDIDFDSLPNQFVLKTNWGAGQVIIVRDKTKINIEETKNKLKYWMQPFCNLYYYYSFEWQYKYIPPKIICEKYIEQSNNQVYDYKVFCFNGKGRYIQVDMDRFIGHKRCIYDTNWNKQQFITGNFQFYSGHINKPYHLDSMIKISEKLAKNFSHVRVDFYEVNNKLFLGELTFTHGNGMERFSIEEWDYKFGELLELPKEKKIEYDILDKDTLFKQVYDLEPISRRYRDIEIQLNKQNAILKNSNIEKLNREIS